ncbi:MAG: DUF4097 family beta strand repeat-containing protein, partial [Spirochaetales bacterium]|nr:DUF4097 family beta strand repeat-containing protein [Spirochaetales bacterium]
NMILEELSIENSDFSMIDFNLGMDGNFFAENVASEKWFIKGKLGKVIAKNISGSMDATTVDGNIEILFSSFSGDTSLSSKLGNITVYLPEQTKLNLDLSSKFENVKTNLPVIGLVSNNSTKAVNGSVGVSSNLLYAHSGDGRIRVFEQKAE